MADDMLVVEDLMLLMMDDETGVPAGAGTLFYVLGGAVLVDLALTGRATVADEGSWRKDLTVAAAGEGPVDPLLQPAYDRIAEKPRGVQGLLAAVGPALQKPVTERLLERGEIREEQRKVLGLFRTTRHPDAGTGHEAGVRERIRAVLEDGAEPDARTAALIALLSASGTLSYLRPPVARWSSAVATRAQELEQGSWGATAVASAVQRTVAAITASTVVATTTVITTSTQ